MSNDKRKVDQSSAQKPQVVPAESPPYRAALVVFAVVLLGYAITLAPTVTFWDAGEFLAAAKILGVPHPPGTPAFVLMANVWGSWFPFGSFAFAVNFMTSAFSAAAAAFMFLVVSHALRGRRANRDPGADPVYVIGGAAAAALMSAYAFTVWQNSNETEVYMFAAFTIAAIAWLACLWRTHRGTSRAAHDLLLIVYLAAFSVGNHLLALLVGPALIGYMWHVLKTEPLEDEADRKVEWAQWAVVGGIWAVLIGSGLGSTGILIFAGLVFIGAAVYAGIKGGLFFTVSVAAIAVVGASTYAFLLIRAGLDPMINEADPSTWKDLLAVIRRDQYPPRLPTDNPMFASGPGNPGRTIGLIWLQVMNYIQYFDWQWSNSLGTTQSVLYPMRLPFTLLVGTLGVYGAFALHQRDRSVFWLLALIFLVTGPGLVGYMNFKPGYALGWDLYPQSEMHEVRERDYFFVVSFQVWGLFAGIGVATLYRMVRDFVHERFTEGQELNALARRDEPLPLAMRLSPAILGLALLPFFMNFSAASRAHGPEATLALDFARNLLQSVEPYGIVFTNGDNDTFPLWYAQEVEGVRQDVSVVNLSLGNTKWYIKQLRDNPVRPFDPDQSPWFAADAPAAPPGPLHSMADGTVDQLRAELLRDSLPFGVGRVRHTFQANTPLYVKDVLMLRLILENAGSRPIYWSTTAGSSNWVGLNDFMIQEGLALRLYVAEAPDPARLAPGLWVPVDLPRTDSLAHEIYNYAGLFDVDSLDLDPTNRNIAGNLSIPYLVLGGAYQARGDRERMLENFQAAYHLSPNETLRNFILSAQAEAVSDVPEAMPLDAFDSLLLTGTQPESLLPADSSSN